MSEFNTTLENDSNVLNKIVIFIFICFSVLNCIAREQQ